MELISRANMLKTNFNVIASTRIKLNEYFYTAEVIQSLIGTIENTFETFTVTYNYDTHTINIKIKKTNLKKNDSSYVHCVQYYYPIINNIFKSLYLDFGGNLVDIFKDYKIIEFLNTDNNVESMYNLTTLLDNIIVIQL